MDLAKVNFSSKLRVNNAAKAGPDNIPSTNHLKAGDGVVTFVRLLSSALEHIHYHLRRSVKRKCNRSRGLCHSERSGIVREFHLSVHENPEAVLEERLLKPRKGPRDSVV